jgi:hypothetical protein
MCYEPTELWKEGVWHILRYYSSIFLEGLRKTTKISVRITGLWDIPTTK